MSSLYVSSARKRRIANIHAQRRVSIKIRSLLLVLIHIHINILFTDGRVVCLVYIFLHFGLGGRLLAFAPFDRNPSPACEKYHLNALTIDQAL